MVERLVAVGLGRGYGQPVYLTFDDSAAMMHVVALRAPCRDLAGRQGALSLCQDVTPLSDRGVTAFLANVGDRNGATAINGE